MEILILILHANVFLMVACCDLQTLGRPDEVIAAETLENYRRQNNSFIHSVFQAQYRSSLSCPRCLTQSNTFDPFQCISVQLPQLFRHSVYVTVIIIIIIILFVFFFSTD